VQVKRKALRDLSHEEALFAIQQDEFGLRQALAKLETVLALKVARFRRLAIGDWRFLSPQSSG
jgi:hypothetical protein